MPLTDQAIRKAKAAEKIGADGEPVLGPDRKPILAPKKLPDGKGLYLEVRPSGAKLWRYRYRIDDKENVFAMGEYFNEPKTAGHVSLEQARLERARCRELVKQGTHPVAEKKASAIQRRSDNANTFEAVGAEWLDQQKPHWSDGHYREVKRMLERDVFKHVGALPIKQVTAARMLEVVERISKRGAPVVAIAVRQWCSGIFAHAVRTLRADGDPTAVLKGHVKRPAVRHKKPLSKQGIKEIVEKIEGAGYVTTRFALKLLLYVFVRPGELRQAEWSEFDLERGVWTIPAAKMKKREVHLVPLSTQAVEMLKALQQITGNRQYLFPNHHRPKDCLSANALNQTLRRLGYAGQFTAHGFRATASTELHELGYRSEIIEFQLAHADRDQTRASYNQAQFWAERKAMMQQWSDIVDAWARGDSVVAANFGRAA